MKRKRQTKERAPKKSPEELRLLREKKRKEEQLQKQLSYHSTMKRLEETLQDWRCTVYSSLPYRWGMKGNFRVDAQFGCFTNSSVGPLLEKGRTERWLEFFDLQVGDKWTLSLEVLETPPKNKIPPMPALLDPDLFDEDISTQPELKLTAAGKALQEYAKKKNLGPDVRLRTPSEVEGIFNASLPTSEPKKDLSDGQVKEKASEPEKVEEEEEEEEEQPVKKKRIEPSPESSEDEGLDPSNILEKDKSEKYNGWRQPALRAECKRRGLPQRGTNAALVERLLDDDRKKSPVKKRFILKKRAFVDAEAEEIPDEEISESEEEEKEF